MNFSLYIARRYLRSKSSKNVVNIISTIAVVGVIVGTIALVVVLSIFNGFELLIKSSFSFFDPEIKITAIEGKQFNPHDSIFAQIKNDANVTYFCEVVEEIAHFSFEERQYIGNIKGVGDDYIEMSHLANVMYDGDLMLNDGNFNYTVIGSGMALNLGVAVNFVKPIFISVPRKGRNTAALMNPFRRKHVYLAGVFSIGQQEVDGQYAIIPIQLARELLDMEGTVTSIEIGFAEGTDVKRAQREIKKIIGSSFKVQNRYQQHESAYRVTQSERFFIYLILSFILIIASFNLASAISMLILDKRKDINILLSLGLTKRKLGLIFLYEGWMVSIIGALIGLIFGVLICLGQMHFGWLKFPGNFAVEYYPVEIRIPNLILITITVLVIGIVASWLPVKLLPKKFFQLDQDN